MIEKIIEWSINNKFMVVLITVFVVLGGGLAMMETPLDAIPDLSDVQVIIYTEYLGQAPQVVEDQITYPLTTAMLSVPFAKVVRGYSFFGFSFVYIIFEEGRNRPLLGPIAGARIFEFRIGPASAGRDTEPGTGRYRCRLDIRIRPSGYQRST